MLAGGATIGVVGLSTRMEMGGGHLAGDMVHQGLLIHDGIVGEHVEKRAPDNGEVGWESDADWEARSRVDYYYIMYVLEGTGALIWKAP